MTDLIIDRDRLAEDCDAVYDELYGSRETPQQLRSRLKRGNLSKEEREQLEADGLTRDDVDAACELLTRGKPFIGRHEFREAWFAAQADAEKASPADCVPPDSKCAETVIAPPEDVPAEA